MWVRSAGFSPCLLSSAHDGRGNGLKAALRTNSPRTLILPLARPSARGKIIWHDSSFAERFTSARSRSGRTTRRQYSAEHGVAVATAASFSRSCTGGSGTTPGGGAGAASPCLCDFAFDGCNLDPDQMNRDSRKGWSNSQCPHRRSISTARPTTINVSPMAAALLKSNLPYPVRRGKVRDVYDLGDTLLIVATDRISAFDCIMPNGIPDKGKILTALSLFWFGKFADRVRKSSHRDGTEGLSARAAPLRGENRRPVDAGAKGGGDSNRMRRPRLSGRIGLEGIPGVAIRLRHQTPERPSADATGSPSRSSRRPPRKNRATISTSILSRPRSGSARRSRRSCDAARSRSIHKPPTTRAGVA